MLRCGDLLGCSRLGQATFRFCYTGRKKQPLYRASLLLQKHWEGVRKRTTTQNTTPTAAGVKLVRQQRGRQPHLGKPGPGQKESITACMGLTSCLRSPAQGAGGREELRMVEIGVRVYCMAHDVTECPWLNPHITSVTATWIGCHPIASSAIQQQQQQQQQQQHGSGC
ncbi:hypothetical protein ABBQ38_004581 [Trebouxia sp. C0009 RCD-2024]